MSMTTLKEQNAIHIVKPEVQISSQPTAAQILASSQPKPVPLVPTTGHNPPYDYPVPASKMQSK